MSHEVSQVNGVTEMFCAGKPAWHKLGQNVQDAPDWKEAMNLSHLNWHVRKEQLEFNGKKVDAWGTFRADTSEFLGQVGPDYQPIQNKESFQFTNALLQSGDVKYESAGALFGGKRTWCLARIPQDIRIAKTDDITKNYFLFTNRHDGHNSAIGKLSGTRVVCNNTLQVALQGSGDLIKIRHTKTSEQQFKDAQELLLATQAQIKDLDGLMNVLAKTQLDMATIGEIIKGVYPDIKENVQEQNKARNVLEIFEDNDNNTFPSERGTAYNLLNAFTKYEDHFASARISDVSEDEDTARARRAMFGVGDVLKFQILSTITKTLHEKSLASFDTSIVTL